MSSSSNKNEQVKAKFGRFVETAGGGIFTRKTRRRLIGVSGMSGRERTKTDFWYDVRNRVKNGLVDLEVFIECAETDQINSVITWDSLTAIISALLRGYTLGGKPDLNRAEIAQMLTQKSLEYLREMSAVSLSLTENRTIEEATDLSQHMLYDIKNRLISKE